jgi:hypothetical protein
MTHQANVVSTALDLASDGLSATEISARTRLPRRTIVDWIAGRVPRRPQADSLCRRCGAFHQSVEPVAETYVYLLGLYLGDGCISRHPRGVYKLRITLDAAYPGIIDEAIGAVRALAAGRSVNLANGHGECFQVYAYSKSWPCVFPQHGPGPKHKRRIALEPWQYLLVHRWGTQFLRGLIHSDGCRFMNTGRDGWRQPRHSFHNYSDDIRRMFCDTCERLGLHRTAANHTIYVSRKADVARMDEFIGPKA